MEKVNPSPIDVFGFRDRFNFMFTKPAHIQYVCLWVVLGADSLPLLEQKPFQCFSLGFYKVCFGDLHPVTCLEREKSKTLWDMLHMASPAQKSTALINVSEVLGQSTVEKPVSL